jgi:hypothetical protein
VRTTNATVETTWDFRASDREEPGQWDCRAAIVNGTGHCRIIQINYLRLFRNGDVQRATLNPRTVGTSFGTRMCARMKLNRNGKIECGCGRPLTWQAAYEGATRCQKCVRLERDKNTTSS